MITRPQVCILAAYCNWPSWQNGPEIFLSEEEQIHKANSFELKAYASSRDPYIACSNYKKLKHQKTKTKTKVKHYKRYLRVFQDQDKILNVLLEETSNSILSSLESKRPSKLNNLGHLHYFRDIQLWQLKDELLMSHTNCAQNLFAHSNM